MGEREDDIRLIHHIGELFGLRQVERHRLVADDIDARLDRRSGDFHVRMVGRGDRDEVDPLIRRQRGFLLDQFLVGTVGASGRNVVIGRRSFGLFRVRGQRTRDQGGPVVQHRGRRVNAANEGPLAAAHKPHPQLSIQCSIGGHRENFSGNACQNATWNVKSRECTGPPATAQPPAAGRERAAPPYCTSDTITRMPSMAATWDCEIGSPSIQPQTTAPSGTTLVVMPANSGPWRRTRWLKM